MKKLMIRALISVASIALVGCGSLSGFGTDNHPKPTALTQFNPEIQVKTVWTASSGNGSAGMQMPLPLATQQGVVFVSHYNGTVAAYEIASGKRLWSTKTQLKLTSGPGVGDHIVAIGSDNGHVVALDKATGKIVWQQILSTQILAAPQIAGGKVAVKTIDGKLFALNSKNGQLAWQYDHSMRSQYMLRASGAPQISQDTVIAGFNDGKLIAVKLSSGQLQWERGIAYPQGASLVQQLIDVDTNPLIIDKTIYIAAYQGNLLAMSFDGNQLFWQREFSTYNNLAANHDYLFATDTDSQVWAFNRMTGHVEWRQDKLAARRITGPVIQNNTLVVGDAEGYLHWLALDDGHFMARTKVSRDGIIATPIVVDNTLLVVTRSGKIAAYRIS